MSSFIQVGIVPTNLDFPTRVLESSEDIGTRDSKSPLFNDVSQLHRESKRCVCTSITLNKTFISEEK